MSRQKTTSEKGKQILARIHRIKPFVEGSLTVTMKRCGNPRCRCASEGPIHRTTLLTWKETGKTRTLHVPERFREDVERWVKEAKLLKRLSKEMSEKQREFLIRRRRSKNG